MSSAPSIASDQPSTNTSQTTEPARSRNCGASIRTLPESTKAKPMHNDPYQDIREEVGKLCARFPGEYWRRMDRDAAYPTEFVQALTAAG